MDTSTAKRTSGFTLIELLVVITIISILATIVFVSLDPVTRFADARNSKPRRVPESCDIFPRRYRK